MKSKVYFIAVKPEDSVSAAKGKLGRLLLESKVMDFIRSDFKVCVKTHFGEAGNTGFVSPEYVQVVCDRIKSLSQEAFLSDANTLYRGRRLNSADHLQLAFEHGFSKESTGLEVIIPDDSKRENTMDILINQKFIKTAKVARIFMETDALVAISHFKGHILTGFGGAIKNIGMGCATREGKLAQHCDVSPVVYAEKCVGCGECELICPVSAIHLENNKSVINTQKCIGCASCMAACPTMAMFIDIGSGGKTQEKMAEYCFAVLKDRKSKAGFVNFCLKINQECDCWGMENPRIAPDVGILASNDPVAIDEASFDLVNKVCGKDIFKEVHPNQDGSRQLKRCEELGLGSRDYELIEL